MGFDLDEASLSNSIATLNQNQWTQVLPVVHIVKLEEQQHTIRVSLPKIGSLLLNWKVTPELGSTIGNEVVGAFNVEDMQVIAESTIDEIQYCQYLINLPSLRSVLVRPKQVARLFTRPKPASAYKKRQAIKHGVIPRNYIHY